MDPGTSWLRRGVVLAALAACVLLASPASAQKPKKKAAAPAKPVSTALPEIPADSPERYLQTNLHYDAKEPEQISSIHYLRGGMIPLCTRVSLGPLEKDELDVTLVDGAAAGRKIRYVFSGHTPKPYEPHLDALFARTCDPGAPARLSAVDAEGVKKGEALVGMSKEGVRMALGAPPAHATPSLESDTWVYWSSRFNKLAVVFQDGKVVTVRN